MIEFMDMITEALEELANESIGNLMIALEVIAKLAILITTPIWILPYKLIMQDINRRKRKKAEKEDKEAGE
jgi:chemotaxis protein CheY-P-specific phosphatase CheC